MTGVGAVVAAAALFLIGGLATTACAYLVLLAVAALRAPAPAATRAPHRRVAILVPAHDEEALIGRCLSSLRLQSYPEQLRELVVIADNCTDATAAIARAAGATVLERWDPERPGKGRALSWAIDQLLARAAPPDAIGVIDADSVADADLLTQLEVHLDLAPAVQGAYLPLPGDGSRRSLILEAAFTLFHRVRLLGRRRLGMPSALVGNGMLFTAALLRQTPWTAYSGVEDLEYTLQLRLRGVRPIYAPCAQISAAVASGTADAGAQRRRWEGGRLHAMRRWLPRLAWAALRRRDPSLLDALLDLAVPPLTLLAMAVAAGLALSLSFAWLGGPRVAMLPWVAAAFCLVAFVGTGFVAGRQPRAAYVALASLPLFLFWKAATYARLLRGFDPNRWQRTPRAAELASASFVGGVRVDGVDMATARSLVAHALEEGGFHQVATVNADFIAQSRRNPAVRELLGRSWLNLPDGAPVVWLARLLGRPVPGRVAGADLVPLLVADASARGVSTFLLGGEHWSAAQAAVRLAAEIPGARIAGWHEPPRAAVNAMEHEAILRRIQDSGAGLLLVALGHPKQDLWIDRNRDRLPVSVAIGVGCVFDLLAGRVSRAPGWMQRSGLEWLYRVLREPRRLGRRYLQDLGCLAAVGLSTLAIRTGKAPVSGTRLAG